MAKKELLLSCIGHQNVLERILDEEIVLIDDKENFHNYLKCFPKKYNLDDFYISEPVAKLYGAWVFKKGLDNKPLKEKITRKLQYLIDTGIYRYYKDSVNYNLFEQHGAFFTTHETVLQVRFFSLVVVERGI